MNSEDNIILIKVSSPDDLSEISEIIEEGIIEDWGLI
jgi:hypothetical protein